MIQMKLILDDVELTSLLSTDISNTNISIKP